VLPAEIDFMAEVPVFGIKAPLFAWTAAAFIVGFALLILGFFFAQVWREKRIHRRVRAAISGLEKQYGLGTAKGLPLEGYDALGRIFEACPQLELPWNSYRANILVQRDPDGQDRVWSAEGAEAAFTEWAVIDMRLNRSFYTAIPTLITGIGLLVTFIAILLALRELRIENNQVLGLEDLIGGLSGKFVSSIAALAAASFFLPIERSLLHGLSVSRITLIKTLDAFVPRLTATRLLSEVHRDISEQSTAFRAFNADLSVRLKQSLSESMGPTLMRLVETIEQLSSQLRAAEATKQDSIANSVGELLKNVEKSLSSSLSSMGDRFTDALSGSAGHQFEDITRSLTATSTLLSGMNQEFSANQAGLRDLVALAKDSTAQQYALGKNQVEELSAVLRALMASLEESAGVSVNNMSAALTAVVADLSDRVGALSRELQTSVSASADKATGAAAMVVEQAGSWSQRSAEQFAALLEKHGANVSRLEALTAAVDRSLAAWNSGFERFAGISQDLRETSAEVKVVATRASDAAMTMRAVQESLQRVAELSAGQVGTLNAAVENERKVWEQLDGRMRQYEEVFRRVDRSAAELLNQIDDALKKYVTTSRDAMDQIVRVGDEHIANAVAKLGGSVTELQEHLEELSDILDRARPAA
jgi:ABC-type transporter Mla subunit MlaD